MSSPILVSEDGNLQIIKMNRPEKKNALNFECLIGLISSINILAFDEMEDSYIYLFQRRFRLSPSSLSINSSPSLKMGTTQNAYEVKPNKHKRTDTTLYRMYRLIKEALTEATKSDNITITVVTGIGEYFTSGNDFSLSSSPEQDVTEKGMRERVDAVRSFLVALIEYPKLLIAVVNGPAIGIGVTMLPLFDVIYALDKATFHTPFSSLGICAEGCSTFTFPRTLGKSLAALMLYFNHKINAKEAKESGLVAQILTERDLPALFESLKEYSHLPVGSLMVTKKMIRSHDYPTLHFANAMELENLIERFQSEEFANAVMNMLMKKKNKL